MLPAAKQPKHEFWWNERKPGERVLWDSKIRLGEAFFNEIVRHTVPLDMNTLTALKRSPLGLDLYLWLTYRTFALRAPQRLTWRLPYSQFGAHPAKSSDNNTVQAFRYKVLRELEKIKLAWPDLNYSTAPGVLILHPSTPVIAPSDHNVHLGPQAYRAGDLEREGRPGGEKRGFGCGPSGWSRTIRRFGRSGTASSSGSRRGSRGSIGSFRRSRGPLGTCLVKRSFFETTWRRRWRHEISGLNWRNRPATTVQPEHGRDRNWP